MSTKPIVFVLFIGAVILGLVFYFYKNTFVISTAQNDKEIFYQLLSEDQDSEWPLEVTTQTENFAEGIYGSGAVIDWVARKNERGEWSLVYKLLLNESICNNLLEVGVPEYFNTMKRCRNEFSL